MPNCTRPSRSGVSLERKPTFADRAGSWFTFVANHRIDDERRDLSPSFDDSLHAEDDGYPKRARPVRHRVERALLVGRVERGHVEILPAQSGEIRLGKAHDHRALR
jgi:hypothetical protein